MTLTPIAVRPRLVASCAVEVDEELLWSNIVENPSMLVAIAEPGTDSPGREATVATSTPIFASPS
jgi:hypothetical protein